MPDFVPAEYKDKLFLTVKDIQEMLQLGENSTYDFLNDGAPFRVVRVGKQIRVPAMGFWSWYAGA